MVRSPSRPLTAVLVASLGRSGSTLLMRLLASSREIASETAYPVEFKYLHYFRVLSRTVDARAWDSERWNRWVLQFTAADQNAAGGLVGPPPWLERGLIEPRAGEEPFGDRVFEAIWGAFSDRVRDRAAQRYGAGPAPVYWVEKSFGAVSLELPSTVPSKTVNVIRDPRDQWLSVLAWTRRSGEEASFADDPREGQRRHLRQFFAGEDRRLARVAEALDARDPDTIVVRYEDLIADGAGQTARLAEFLDTELDVSELERIDLGHGTSTSPADSVGRGRTELAAEELAWIEERLGAAMAYFGYDGGRPPPRKPAGERAAKRTGDSAPPSPQGLSRSASGGGAPIGGLERLEHLARYSVAARVVAGLEVLDVGCATGEGAAALIEGGAERVVGIDGDQAALAAARLRAPEADFLRAAPGALPFADASFDVAVCMGSLPARGSKEWLLELRRVLRGDGVLVVSAPNAAIEPSPEGPATDDWLPSELIDAVSGRFRNVAVLRQHHWLASSVVADDRRAEPMAEASVLPPRGVAAGDERHTVVIASDAPLPERRLSVVAVAAVDLEGVLARLRAAERANAGLRRSLDDRNRGRAARRRARSRLVALLARKPRLKRLAGAVATRSRAASRLRPVRTTTANPTGSKSDD